MRMGYWSDGVMEYWSVGASPWRPITPLPHCPITPLPHPSGATVALSHPLLAQLHCALPQADGQFNWPEAWSDSATVRPAPEARRR